METENSELRFSINKLEEEIKHLSSQLTSTHTDVNATNPKFNCKVEKDSIGSDSPERFEIVDKNMPLFKQRGSTLTLDDNVSNNSFNTNEWMNLNIPHEIQSDNFSKSIEFDIR